MVKVVHYAVEMAPQEVHVADGLLVNSASYVGKQLKTDTHVPGRLWADDHADFYHDVLGANMETVAIICHGYVIPFDEPPPVTGIVPNNKSCDTNPLVCVAGNFVLHQSGVHPGGGWPLHGHATSVSGLLKQDEAGGGHEPPPQPLCDQGEHQFLLLG